jgi:transcriptional regulator with XRE-family HTH domain
MAVALRTANSYADEHFPDRLRFLRIQACFSQRELSSLTAERAGQKPLVTERTISHWETGRTRPYLGRHFKAVAWALGVTPGYLLQGEEGERYASTDR